jgi:hypothetical protein
MAAAAHLARFKGQSRVHTESDLRAFLIWCAERAVDPLATSRPYIELYVRWMQEQRRFAASHRLAARVGRRRVLPHLRHRRRPGTLPPPNTYAAPPSPPNHQPSA